jgi:hypothetical protein
MYERSRKRGGASFLWVAALLSLPAIAMAQPQIATGEYAVPKVM